MGKSLPSVPVAHSLRDHVGGSPILRASVQYTTTVWLLPGAPRGYLRVAFGVFNST
jgi:hypothetical protein